MKTSFISSLSLSNTLRSSLLKAQASLQDANKEVTTGRFADVGLNIGLRTGQTVALRQQYDKLATITDTNGLVSSRLDATQEAMGGMLETAQNFLSNLIGVRSGEVGKSVIGPQARNNLQALTGALNSSFNGQYLFSGLNTQVQPVNDYYETPPPPNKVAVDTAFLGFFGFAQNDPAVATITPAQMQTFLDTQLLPQFDDPAWGANWSNASAQNVTSRISPSEVVQIPTNANQNHFRQLAAAYTMMSELNPELMTQDAFQVLVDTALEAVGSATQGVTASMAQIGSVQERVKFSSERMSLQKDIISRQVQAFEGVDPYEASTRVTRLTTQIETSYALTARIQNLSILNYLR